MIYIFKADEEDVEGYKIGKTKDGKKRPKIYNVGRLKNI